VRPADRRGGSVARSLRRRPRGRAPPAAPGRLFGSRSSATFLFARLFSERDERAGLDLGNHGEKAYVLGIAGDSQAMHRALAARPLEQRGVLEAEVAK
jgi:hypothetical protein